MRKVQKCAVTKRNIKLRKQQKKQKKPYIDGKNPTKV